MLDVSSDYAIEGTAAHYLAETCADRGDDALDWVGRTVPVIEGEVIHKILVTLEMAQAVNRFIDYCDACPGEKHYENRLGYTNWVEDAFGTADFIAIDDGVATVVDLKFGKGIQVYAENNSQLKMYAMGVVQEFGYLYEISSFKLCIYQPRLDHIDEWIISISDLLKWAEEEVRPAGVLAMTPDAPFKSGSWCQFCLIKLQCRCRDETTFTQVVNDFEEVTEETEIMKAAYISLDELALRLPLVKAIKEFCKDLEDRAVSELGKGNTITHPEYGDYKMVAGRGGRKWKNSEEDTMKILRGKFKLRVKDITTQKLLTAPALEKVVGKTSEIMTELVEKVAGKATLARGDDKRESLQVEASEEFSSED